MVGVSLVFAMTLGLVLLAVHLVSVTLTKAFRAYSPSRLGDLCGRRGRPWRAEEVDQNEDRTARAVEVLAVLTGLALAALLGVVVGQHAAGDEPVLPLEGVVAIATAVGAAGYVLSGVLGRVFPEEVIDRLWPVARWFRVGAGPIAHGIRRFERLVEYLATPRGAEPRPASVEVEIPPDSDHPEDAEPELDEPTREMIQRVIEMPRRDVSELATPRSRIVALPGTISARAAARAIAESGRSRVPLYGETHDDIVGVLYAKDLFAAIADAPTPEAVAPVKLACPPHFVPESKNARDLFREMREDRTQLALVIDEFGVVTGLVTLEDLVEAIVGPIDDERDAPTPADPVLDLGEKRYEVDATLSIDELNERLDLRLPTDGDFQTVGGLAFHSLGRVPEPGATFRVEGVEFQIIEIADHSIRRVRIDLQPATVGR